MNHTIEFLGTMQVRNEIDIQTTATIKSNVAAERFQIASVRRLTMQGNRAGFEEEHSNIENKNGKRTES